MQSLNQWLGPFSNKRLWKADKVTGYLNCADSAFLRPLRFLLHETNRKNKSIGAIVCLILLNLVSPKKPELKCQGSVILEPEFSYVYSGETVSTSVVLCVAFLIPLFEFIIAEWIIEGKAQNLQVEGSRWNKTLFYAFRWYRDYFFGIAFMILINDIAKTTVGAPRPHWIDTCQPQFPAENCYSGWVANYTCTNGKFSRLRLADGRKSFPSGHSAMSFYSALFMILYQSYRMECKKLGSFVILLLNGVWAFWAVYCSLSRIADHRHHPIDVICGATLGALGSGLTALILCMKFRQELITEPNKNQVEAVLNGKETLLEDRSFCSAGMNNSLNHNHNS